ncbi:MAG: DEAD/DEAH box helicase [Pseudomonadota bacterium]|jgi:ATP-dependent RNA helicase DeaD
MSSPEQNLAFADLALPAPLLEALSAVGYEQPSPIQAATIPHLLAGRDLLGTAQTGTGKTAAFALPILARIDVADPRTQALVLAPTRELAIQVAEAFQKYAATLPGFHVLPIYGGQAYGAQFHGLKRGAHVVVGTPGRVIDHLDRGSLDLSRLRTAVLDEADEMLRMGFIDDVEKVLAATPATRQVVLFSATMPPPIRRIAQTWLKDPAEVRIQSRTTTAAGIRQRYWAVSGLHKLDALTRILEAEPFEAMIVFARTKQATEELAERLAARGFAAAAINGDVEQKVRERTIQRLKDGQVDILVATDVAARGLDVDRISHVLNYDIPYDAESYVHRIGRTGRAGRTGEAILFVTPRERPMLRVIERTTRQSIEPMHLPTVAAVNDRRIARFMQKIAGALAQEGLEPFRTLVQRFEAEHDVPATEIAAALARIAHGNKPLLLEGADPAPAPEAPRESSKSRRERLDARPGGRGEAETDRPSRPRLARAAGAARTRPGDSGLATWRVSVGHRHGVKPGNLVGAIANEAGLDASAIGRIEIEEGYSRIDLPANLPPAVVEHLAGVRVAGQKLRLAPWRDPAAPSAARPRPWEPGDAARGDRPRAAMRPKPHRKGPPRARGEKPQR